MHVFCPGCFAEAGLADRPCPRRGGVAPAWEARPGYTARLIHALRYPHPEARRGAIITLGNRRDVRAALPLAECALAHALDSVQGMAIVCSLGKLPDGPARAAALARLAGHSARAIRRAVAELQPHSGAHGTDRSVA
jgi:HEAT repeat protein